MIGFCFAFGGRRAGRGSLYTIFVLILGALSTLAFGDGTTGPQKIYVPGTLIAEECSADKSVSLFGNDSQEMKTALVGQNPGTKSHNIECNLQWALRYSNTMYFINYLYHLRLSEEVKATYDSILKAIVKNNGSTDGID